MNKGPNGNLKKKKSLVLFFKRAIKEDVKDGKTSEDNPTVRQWEEQV